MECIFRRLRQLKMSFVCKGKKISISLSEIIMVSQEADSLTKKTMKRKQCINKKIWSSRVRGLDTVSKCLCAIHWTSKDYNRAAFIHFLVWERTKQYRVDHVRHSVSPGSSEATEGVGKKTWIFREPKTPNDNGKLTWSLSFVFYAQNSNAKTIKDSLI